MQLRISSDEGYFNEEIVLSTNRVLSNGYQTWRLLLDDYLSPENQFKLDPKTLKALARNRPAERPRVTTMEPPVNIEWDEMGLLSSTNNEHGEGRIRFVVTGTPSGALRTRSHFAFRSWA